MKEIDEQESNIPQRKRKECKKCKAFDKSVRRRMRLGYLCDSCWEACTYAHTRTSY